MDRGRYVEAVAARIVRNDVLMGVPHHIVANLVIPARIGSALCLPRMALDG
jgi:hypothetical protein